MQKLIPEDSVLVPDNAKLVFRGMIFDVYQWPQELYDGSEHTFEMLKRPDTVNAICIINDKILMLDDEQPHLGGRQTFPGGRVDPEDASTEAAAKRETHEETGYSFNNWRLIKVSQPFRKIEWFTYLWLAWDIAATETPHIDAGEKITVHLLGFEELKAKVVARTGYLGEAVSVFEGVESVEQLLALPEFSGQAVDR